MLEKYKNKIIQGDCLEVLKTLPDESIDMVMTSPPYWALRDYGVDGQLGLEPTFQGYINKLCDIFDEVKRVLKKEGTCWVNMGDTYISKGEGRHDGYTDPKYKNGRVGRKIEANALPQIIPEKCLAQIPSRFAIEMTNRGWILRNEIIWHKPNCMPSSVKDRFTVDFEKLFFFVKSKKYWFETQYEELAYQDRRGNQRIAYKGKLEKNRDKFNIQPVDYFGQPPQGRNKRTVWTITTKPYKEAHFATYPEQLCETPIKAGCPKFICKKCGKAREKIIEIIPNPERSQDGRTHTTEKHRLGKTPVPEKGWQTEKIEKGLSDCGCNAGWEKGIVLDPFFGAGTTGLVAQKLKRNYIGIELNPEYIKIAEQRLRQEVLL